MDGPIPLNFYNERTGEIDWIDMQEDLRLKLANAHIGLVNGISTEELARYYFGRIDLEALLCMGNQLQIVRKQMLVWEYPVILRSAYSRWHIADTADEHFSFIRDRTMRIVRAHGRLKIVTKVATGQYPELENYSTIRAITGMDSSIRKLESAVIKNGSNLLQQSSEKYTIECKRCTYIWNARKANPKMCPHCKSKFWNQTYVDRKKREKKLEINLSEIAIGTRDGSQILTAKKNGGQIQLWKNDRGKFGVVKIMNNKYQIVLRCQTTENEARTCYNNISDD